MVFIVTRQRLELNVRSYQVVYHPYYDGMWIEINIESSVRQYFRFFFVIFTIYKMGQGVHRWFTIEYNMVERSAFRHIYILYEQLIYPLHDVNNYNAKLSKLNNVFRYLLAAVYSIISFAFYMIIMVWVCWGIGWFRITLFPL